MAALEKGITRYGTGYGGKTWNIFGQVYFPKAVTIPPLPSTNSEPGQFVPVHVHPTQDEFILVQEGVLDLKLDGVWVQAKAGDLVRMPRGIPHGYFNKSDKPARALFWVSPMQKLEALFNQLHNLTDPMRKSFGFRRSTRSIFCRPRPTSRSRLRGDNARRAVHQASQDAWKAGYADQPA